MKAMNTVLCASLLAASGAAAAQDDFGPFRRGWHVAPMFSYTKVDKERQTDDGLGLTLAIGNRGDFGTLEIASIFTTLGDGKDGAEAKLTGGQLGLLVGPFFDNYFLARFFGVVGFGVFRREDHPGFTQDDTTIFGDAGLGYMHPLAFFGRDFNIRSEVRYRYDVQQRPRPEGTPPQFQDYVLNIGLQFPLGQKPVPAPVPVAVVPVVTDADGDGVLDPVDQCPGTPAGSIVNEVGCVRVAALAPVVLSGVNFEINSAQLTVEARTILDTVAKNLLTTPTQKHEVRGHTDSAGEDVFNRDLSQRRAESVRAYLIGKGVNADSLTAAGYGESQPLDSNDTVEGRANNRRVELKTL